MLNQLFYNRFTELIFQRYNHTSVNASLHSCVCVFLHNRDTHNTCMLGILENISPSELVSNGYTVFQIIIKCGAHAQNSKSHVLYIFAVSESMLLK